MGGIARSAYRPKGTFFELRTIDTHKKSPTKSAFRQRGTSSPHRSIYYYYLIYYLGNYVYPPPIKISEEKQGINGLYGK